jgi:hypothetical protein
MGAQTVNALEVATHLASQHRPGVNWNSICNFLPNTDFCTNSIPHRQFHLHPHLRLYFDRTTEDSRLLHRHFKQIPISSTMNSTAQSTARELVDADASSPQNAEKHPSPRPSVTELSHFRHSDASQDGSAAAKHGAQWVTGMELAALSVVLIAAMFLMMLDTSIIATAVSATAVHARDRH